MERSARMMDLHLPILWTKMTLSMAWANPTVESTRGVGYESSSYTLYEDDGIHKDYDKKENYRVLTK